MTKQKNEIVSVLMFELIQYIIAFLWIGLSIWLYISFSLKFWVFALLVTIIGTGCLLLDWSIKKYLRRKLNTKVVDAYSVPFEKVKKH